MGTVGAFPLNIQTNNATALRIGATGVVDVPGTTSASSSTVGALTIGNGTAATNVAIGGGNVNAGGTLTVGGTASISTGASAAFLDFVTSGTTASQNIQFSDSGGASGAIIYTHSTNAMQFKTNGDVWATLGNTGALSLASTSPSTGSTSGALQVAGGIYAGAASVFGGAVTGASTIQVGTVLRVGGATASFPGLRNTGAQLDVVTASNSAWADIAAAQFKQSDNGISWSSGTGSPEGVKTAPVGSLYSRTDGGASTTLYVKQSGTGNTGWVAK
jgi:hypothetical protein